MYIYIYGLYGIFITLLQGSQALAIAHMDLGRGARSALQEPKVQLNGLEADKTYQFQATDVLGP